ncbi:MAG: hypothetical protein ACRCU2_00830 [Planktothrix sp.]
MVTSVDTAIDRILAINWEPNDTRTNSHVVLLQEYLRRAALWAEALNCTDEWPFFDVVAHLSPSLQPENHHLERLEQHFSQVPFYVTEVIEKTCRWFVFWEGVKKSSEYHKFLDSLKQHNNRVNLGMFLDVLCFNDLPHPYEPLILLYERGGIFYSEHGFFCFEDAAVPRGTWREHWQPEAAVGQLNAEALDNLDGNFGESFQG